jgi:hypothetical protein
MNYLKLTIMPKMMDLLYLTIAILHKSLEHWLVVLGGYIIYLLFTG